MNGNLLADDMESRLKKAEKRLSAYTRERDPEQLHLLRVEIKKTKAVLSLIKSTYKRSYRITKLKSVFQQAGKIRELQINIQLLEALPQVDENVITELKTEESQLCEAFINNAPLFIAEVKSFRKKLRLPAGFPPERKIKKYFRRKLDKVMQNTDPDREKMHLLRMIIKEMMYVFDALPKRLRKHIIINKPYIDRFQQKAGDWHDTYAGISFLSGQSFPAMDEVISKLQAKESGEFNDLTLFMRKLKNEISI